MPAADDICLGNTNNIAGDDVRPYDMMTLISDDDDRPSVLIMLMLQPLGIEETKGLIIPLAFLLTINLLFNNWAKDQVRSTYSLASYHHVLVW